MELANLPMEQAEQKPAPAAEYFPAKHVCERLEPFLAKLPAETGVHELKPWMPWLAPYVPAGQS